jgi:hypothetical protein
MEIKIEGTTVTLAELREQVAAAKEAGLAGKASFTLETVEALLDQIESRKPGFSLEDIENLYREKSRALWKELPWPGDMTVEERENMTTWETLKALETAGLARQERTPEHLVWHFVPTEGPSVPKYHYRNT